MSYAVRRVADSATSNHGQAPPTATVLDYMCLFTHDLRRKQKRWQDGKLKYHSFNKRIMVYDDRGNFVGDGHWHASGDLEEGEELELDRGAAIVQVANCVGAKEQDLTEILDKRAREVEKRRAIAAAKTPTLKRARPEHQPNDYQGPQPHFQMNHRPLSSIVPSPGPIGRAAISDRSPYEARRISGDAPPARKKRSSVSPPSKAGFAQNLFGTKLNLSACAASVSSLRMRASRAKINMQVDKRPRALEDDVAAVKENTEVGTLVRREVQDRKAKDMPSQHIDKTEPPVKNNTPLASRERGSTESEVEEVINTVPQVAGRQLKEHNVTLEILADLPVILRHRRDSNEVTEISQLEKIPAEPRGATRPRKAHRLPSSPTKIDKDPVMVLAYKDTSHIETKQNPRHTADKVLALNDLANRSTRPRAVQPRTELRIKSRPKRGLLMVAERKQEQILRQPTSVTSLSPSDGQSVPAKRSPSVSQSDTLETMPSRSGDAEVEVIKERSEKSSPASEIEYSTEDAKMEDEIDLAATLLPDKPCSKPASRNNTKLDAKKSSKICITREPTPPGKTARINIETENEPEHATRRTRYSLPKHPESESEFETVLQRPRKKQKRVPPKPQSLEDSSSEETEGLPMNRRRMAKAQDVSKSHFDQLDAQEDPQVPRIARLARRSVKSKEIFGFVPPVEENCAVPVSFTMATSRIGTVGRPPTIPTRPPGVTLTMKPSTVAESTSKKPDKLKRKQDSVRANKPERGDNGQERSPRMEATSNEPASVQTSSETALCQEEPTSVLLSAVDTNPGVPAAIIVSPPRPLPVEQAEKERKGNGAALKGASSTNHKTSNVKVINPATRGKKAARKEDAAGAIPQSIVPFEAPQLVRVPPPRTTRPPEPSKRPGDMPGFSTANGGAWSKHAEDLLGMTRPTGRRGN